MGGRELVIESETSHGCSSHMGGHGALPNRCPVDHFARGHKPTVSVVGGCTYVIARHTKQSLNIEPPCVRDGTLGADTMGRLRRRLPRKLWVLCRLYFASPQKCKCTGRIFLICSIISPKNDNTQKHDSKKAATIGISQSPRCYTLIGTYAMR